MSAGNFSSSESGKSRKSPPSSQNVVNEWLRRMLTTSRAQVSSQASLGKNFKVQLPKKLWEIFANHIEPLQHQQRARSALVCEFCDRPWCRKVYETFSTSCRKREPSMSVKYLLAMLDGLDAMVLVIQTATTLKSSRRRIRLDTEKNTGWIHAWDCVSFWVKMRVSSCRGVEKKKTRPKRQKRKQQHEEERWLKRIFVFALW